MKNHDLEQMFLQFRDDGDMRALARLFDNAAPQLLPVAVHLAARREDADDLIQATFLTAIERAESYERGRAVLPWLLGILALHARKLRQKQGRTLDLDRVHQPSENDPERQAASAEVRQAVDTACRTLPAAYATIVQRHLVEGLEPLELASEMGLSNGAARVRLHRGMKLLRRALPAAFSSGAYAASSTRGIAAIREAVLERASMLTGSPVPAAGFAPLGLLLSFLLPFAVAVPAWLSWHSRVTNAPEASALAVAPSSKVTSNTSSISREGADLALADLERTQAANEAESETNANEFNSNSSDNATVRGRLMLAGGVPAAGASVHLTGWVGNEERKREYGLPANWHDPEDALTAADGRFEFSFDPPRAFCFKMTADHASAAQARWNWFEIPPGGTIDLGDIALEPTATIVAHLVDAQSNPLSSGWTLYVDASAPTAAQGRSATSIKTKWTEGSNDFVIERVPARRVTVKAETENDGLIEPAIVELVAGQTKQIELRYIGPDLSRRILVITSSNPFFMSDDDSYQVSATKPGSAPILAAYSQTGMMAYVIDGCDPGDYQVTVTAPRFVSWAKSAVHPGDIVRAKLVGDAGIRLLVTDANAAPYTGPYTLMGKYTKSRSSPNSFVLVDPTKGIPAGNVIHGMPSGDYDLTLEVPGQPAKQLSVIGLSTGETRDVPCTLGSSLTIHGRIVAQDGTTPVSGVDVQLTRGNRPGHTLGAGHIALDHDGEVPRVDQRVNTDAQGEFAFSGLTAGHWSVRAAWGNYVRVDRAIDLGAQTEPLTIQRPPMGFLSGHVLVPPGAPLEDTVLTVRIVEDQGWTPARSPSDCEHDELQNDGSFHFGPLPAGEVQLGLLEWTSNGTSGSAGGIGTIHTAVIQDGVDLQAEIDLRTTFPGRLQLHVVIDDHAATGGNATWSLVGAPLDSGGSFGGHSVNLDGVCRLGAISPGAVKITYSSADETWAWTVPQAIAIEPGQEKPYELVLHTTERDLRCVDVQGGANLANVEVEWRTSLEEEPLTAKARTDAAGLLHLRIPDQQVEVRCVGDSGAFTTISWGAGTGPLSVSLHRVP